MNRQRTNVRQVLSCVGAALCCLTSITQAHAEPVSWKQDCTFKRTSFEEDIKVTLRELISVGGFIPIIKDGVKGSITFDFGSMSCTAAFNKLMEENNLQAEYDPAANTVTISAAADAGREVVLITPQHLGIDGIRSALKRFGMEKSANIISDQATGSLYLEGSPSAVANIKQVITEIDAAEGKRQEKQRKDAEEREKRKTAEIEREKIAAEMAAEAERLALEREKMNEELRQRDEELRQRIDLYDRYIKNAEFKVKIIPLRYANAGSVTMQFKGEAVKVPGIDETLRTMFAPSSPKKTEAIKNDKQGDSNAVLPPEVELAEYGGVKFPPPGISIDTRTNSIVVRGTEEAIRQVEEVVRQLDKPVPMIELEVIIAEASAGTSRELGIKWGMGKRTEDGRWVGGLSTLPSSGDGSFSNYATNYQKTIKSVTQSDWGIVNSTSTNTKSAGTSTDSSTTTTTNSSSNVTWQNDWQDGTIAPSSDSNIVTRTRTVEKEVTDWKVDPISLLPMNVVGAGGLGASFLYSGGRGLLASQIDAMKTENALHVLSSPKVITLNHLEAKIVSSETVNIPVYNEGKGIASMQEIDAGISLEITPSIITDESAGEHRFVRLALHGNRSSFTSSSGDKLGTAEKEIQTTVIIPDETTFILGGLFETTTKDDETGVPGLKDIPILGWLFKNEGKADERKETIFIITPKILELRNIVSQDIGVRAYMHSRMDESHRKMQDSMPMPKPGEIEEDE